MTTKYFAILTNQGAARLANATMLGTKLNITQMAVGDGNGTLPTPDPAQTKLINQTRIAPINSLSVDANDAGQIIAEQIIPENEGGFFIREIGLYDDDGILIAVANCPETYKPLLAEGSGRTQTIRMILVVSSTSAITLKIDPSVVLATRKYVDDAVIEVKSYVDGLMRNHEQSRNHPDATTTAKGFTQLNSSVTDDRETQSATPKAVKIAMDNANARLAKERNLADLPNPALARQNLQLGDSSTKNTGTTANTVAAGDDARITGAMQKSQNGADIPDVAKFLQNLQLGEAAKREVGMWPNQIPDMGFFQAIIATGNTLLKFPFIDQYGNAKTIMVQFVTIQTRGGVDGGYPLPYAFPNAGLFATGNRATSGYNAAMNVRIASNTTVSIQNWAPSGALEDCCLIVVGW
ncbi:phage tail protein [Citrobacter braakii]|uniref:phage tail protein n=3 Tax=Enterobacterales TaxID=91347 RepID=UPI00388514E1